ncbi:CAAX box protein 1-like, partial [Balaenoptera acutorostrata]|uniref:CAAX box protein 1-like n=1 Tax=Balaenoptera acutorostrata TaxID=9767 RepID=A0ABM3SV09_BALAC
GSPSGLGAGARGRVRRASRRRPDRHRRRPPAAPPPSLTFGSPRSPPRSCPLPRSACLCSRNSAPGSRCCRRRAWLWSGRRPLPLGPARPLPCTLGLGRALQLQAGLLLHADRPPSARPLPTARPLPDSQARMQVPRDLRCRCRRHRHRHPPHPAYSLQPSAVWTRPGGV